ncbi:SIR2 family protein [Agromyces sp. Root1464]|uniref:SIR2 family protein n=1 Tax=Agromyces sp. Root1464 TaxID=1736467 RepID=UPI00138ECBB8|nr:SIR2 family protein [Agromyces sp. Root1464]
MSKKAPSSLPLFGELAAQIASHFNQPFTSEAESRPDVFLGRLDLDGLDVRSRTREIVGAPGSTPNENHQALLRLGASSKAIRIVTTNYDNHLLTAAAEQGILVDSTYFAPALPLGRSFEGIVHLHGSILRGANEFVLTDRDFGRAYLTDGWASRFLEQMFREYTVLFVGYSHNDLIVNYLARGLGDGGNRYILTENGSNPEWAALGVRPISFSTANDFQALTDVLEAWAERAQMGALDHRSRMQDLLSGKPPQTPVERDYLEDTVATPLGGELFDSLAKGVDWLDWCESQPIFLENFRPGAHGVATESLGRWFARTFVADPSAQAAALGVFQRNATEVSSTFLATIARESVSLAKLDRAAFRRWVPVLLSHAPQLRGMPRVIEQLIGAFQMPDDADLLIMLLRIGLDSRLALHRRYQFAGDSEGIDDRVPDAELEWTLDYHAASAAWFKLREQKDIDEESTLLMFESALVSAYQLLKSYNQGLSFDPLSFGRSAIEDHEQDSHRSSTTNLVIDALRSLSESSPDDHLSERWIASEFALFRRLALHRMAKSPVDPDAKLEWVMRHDLIFDVSVHHEVYRLLGEAVPEASSEPLAALLQRVLAHNQQDDLQVHRVLNLIAFMAGKAPNWQEVHVALEQIGQQHPTVPVTDHEDFTHYSWSGVAAESSLYDQGELASRLTADLSRTLRELMTADYAQVFLDGPTWDGTLQALAALCSNEPDLGLRIWDEVSGKEFSPIVNTVRGAVLAGWSSSAPGELWPQMLERAATATESSTLPEHIARLLRAGAKSGAPSEMPFELLDRAAQIVDSLWAAQSTQFSHDRDAEWVSLALNSWPGHAADFWIYMISRVWAVAGDQWQGIPVDMRNSIETMLSAASPARDAVVPAFGSELYFLFGADDEFARTVLFPLFDWSVDERAAKQAWDGYLYGARFNLAMLAAGFFEAVVGALPRVVGALSDGQSRQYFELLVYIAAWDSERRPLVLATFLGTASTNQRERFAAALSRVLDYSTTEDVDKSWGEWIGRYVNDRLVGVGGAPSQQEANELGSVVAKLEAEFPTAVEMILKHPVGFVRAFDLQELGKNDGLLKTQSTAVLRFIAHLLAHTPVTDLAAIGYRLAEIVPQLHARVPPSELSALVDLATSKGISGPTEWLNAPQA